MNFFLSLFDTSRNHAMWRPELPWPKPYSHARVRFGRQSGHYEVQDGVILVSAQLHKVACQSQCQFGGVWWSFRGGTDTGKYY